MTPNQVIQSLIHSINADKRDQFYLTASNYIATLSHGGDWHSKLSATMRQRPMKMVRLDNLSADLKKLLNQEGIPGDEPYLNPAVNAIISELLSEWKNKEVFKSHALPVRSKILLYGPTGNGKTTIAKYLSKITGLPFVQIDAEQMIDSHVGTTGRNISSVMNSIKEPCILFWDEIDTIGVNRSAGLAGAEVENTRMVNAFLVNLERLENDVIFIGATNREGALDPAFTRRFDVRIEIASPTDIEKQAYADLLFKRHKIESSVLDFSELNSYSRIKDEIINLARKIVISKLEKQIA